MVWSVLLYKWIMKCEWAISLTEIFIFFLLADAIKESVKNSNVFAVCTVQSSAKDSFVKIYRLNLNCTALMWNTRDTRFGEEWNECKCTSNTNGRLVRWPWTGARVSHAVWHSAVSHNIAVCWKLWRPGNGTAAKIDQSTCGNRK